MVCDTGRIDSLQAPERLSLLVSSAGLGATEGCVAADANAFPGKSTAFIRPWRALRTDSSSSTIAISVGLI
jgi:hypothetical protein